MKQKFPSYLKPEWYELFLMSPYIEKITPHQVIYTEEFKVRYSRLYQEGLSQSEIMIECGFPAEYAKTRSMQSFRRRYKDYYLSEKYMEDKEARKEAALTFEEMNRKIQRLEQENEFLKKKLFIIRTGRYP